MLTLAVETSTANGSIALFDETKLLIEKSWARSGSHSELLTDLFQTLLKEQKIKIADIKRLAVGVGPGSFTGARVAVNFARALAFAQNISVFALNSLELLVNQPELKNAVGEIGVFQYAFRDIAYFASYQLDEGRAPVEVSAPVAITAQSLVSKLGDRKKIVLLGDGLEKLDQFLPPDLTSRCSIDKNLRAYPLASDFTQTKVASLSSSELTDWNHVIPLYIRASEAEEKLKRGLIKPT